MEVDPSSRILTNTNVIAFKFYRKLMIIPFLAISSASENGVHSARAVVPVRQPNGGSVRRLHGVPGPAHHQQRHPH